MTREELKAYAIGAAQNVEDDVFVTECNTVSYLIDNCFSSQRGATRKRVSVINNSISLC